MTSLGYDDRSEWNKYAITMPVTRKHLVYSKYLLSILAIGITGILCIVLILLIDKGFTSESLFTITSSLSIGVLFISIILPFNFRFGLRKADLLYLDSLVFRPY